MKSVCFIESPLQLLNAYEAEIFFNIKNLVYNIRLSGNLANDKQILKLIAILKIVNYNLIIINVLNKGIKDYLNLFYYTKIFKIPDDIERIFIGNYNSGFFNLIMKKIDKTKIILLDDGAKTIDIQTKFTNIENYNLFTMYNFKTYTNQIISKNSYTRLQKNLKQLVKNKNEILFLGLKLSEIGIVSQEYYLQQIKNIACFYQDKKIIYILHRGESLDKLEKLNKISNIDIVQLHYPVELYGFYNKSIPYKVSSFYSTALLTMKNIYDIEAEGFNFNYLRSIHKPTIDNVYKYNKKYFKIINLENI